MSVEIIQSAELLNELVKVMRAKWGENSDMAIAGALSSVVTNSQIEALIEGNR